MAVDVLWSPRAEEDLTDIYAYIALDNPDAAERVVGKIVAAAGLLSQYPRLCQRRPDIHPSLRMMTEGPYLILYETFPDSDTNPVSSVIVVRVIDARRDLPASL